MHQINMYMKRSFRSNNQARAEDFQMGVALRKIRGGARKRCGGKEIYVVEAIVEVIRLIEVKMLSRQSLKLLGSGKKIMHLRSQIVVLSFIMIRVRYANCTHTVT